jgi:FPC/CPF motif-containing protein YcgG
LDEAGFEAALWQRLQALHRRDAQSFRWDASVSSDPASPQFSMSLGGRAFYVIGVHPGAQPQGAPLRLRGAGVQPAQPIRDPARGRPLREDARGHHRARHRLQRLAQPDAGVHGEASEARQYSGRVVGAQWRCPFSAQAE